MTVNSVGQGRAYQYSSKYIARLVWRSHAPSERKKHTAKGSDDIAKPLGMQLATLWSSREVADLWSGRPHGDSSCFTQGLVASSATLPHNTRPLSAIASSGYPVCANWLVPDSGARTGRPVAFFPSEGAWL